MRRKLYGKQRALVNQTGPILLHDNARLYVSQRTLQKLNELSYEICLIRLNLQTCRQLTTSFSSIWKTSSRSKIFKQREPSWDLSAPGHQISIKVE
jgi:hypothetical protein